MTLNAPEGRSEWLNIRLGDEILAKIEYGMTGGSMLPPEKGRVVYIHPEGRFYTLEFRFDRGSFRESYPLV